MHCLILSESSCFPWGMASTTRVRNIGKALIHQGVFVQYIGLKGAGTDYHKSKKRRGLADGIKYYYPGGFSVRSNIWFIRRIDDFLGKWLSLIKIKQLAKYEALDTVIIYSRSYKTVMFWTEKLKRMGIKVILELCEWPLSNNNKNKYAIENAHKFCNQAVLIVDAILPISKHIEKKVEETAKINAKTIPSYRIPILNDIDYIPDHELKESKPTKNYILYSGSVNYMDIALFIVDIVNSLKAKGYVRKLLFTGGGERHLFERIREYANQMGVQEIIEFTDYMEEKELQRLMSNALCLLAPMPESEQSKARFPTKLGYYLASGRPVITNCIGSINEYLTDEVNAYIANNYQVELFVKKIIAIIKSPGKADEIGTNGRLLAFEKFYYKNACSGLREFLEGV